MRLAQVLIAVLACAMALSVESIYYLFLLCGDFVYVILWPQLLCCLYIRWSNSYGSFMGFVLGLLFRLLGGEPGLSLDPVIGKSFAYCGRQRHLNSILVYNIKANLKESENNPEQSLLKIISSSYVDYI